MATVYRDSTPLTDAQKASLEALATAIRSKKYGKDVREAIASAIEMVGMPGVTSYFTPKGVKDNLAALQAEFPSGTDGIYITKDNGYWNFWNGTAWEKGNVYQSENLADGSVVYPLLNDFLQNRLLGKQNLLSNTFSRGLFSTGFSVVDTASWSFRLLRVKKGEIYSVDSMTDGSQPVLILFDNDFDVVDSNYSYEIDSYKILQDGYLAINFYHGASTQVSGNSANTAISGNSNSEFLKTGKIADKVSLTFNGYFGIAAGSITTDLISNVKYKTTDFLKVDPDSFILITSYFGMNNGVLGYRDNTSTPEILSVAINSNDFVEDMLVKIPADINYIRISSNTDYPFYVFKTEISEESIAERNIEFNNPSASGTTTIQIKNYFPFSTERILISKIEKNASLGIAYGDPNLGNSIRVRITSRSKCTVELYVGGSLKQIANFDVLNPINKILQVQNTGRALIILLFKHDMSNFENVGRFDYGANLDARLEEYTYSWKTYIVVQTDSATPLDSAQLGGFNSAIRSGSISTSIRFLTYEDGTFIQKGNWMYYLAEGTGESISDLFTQIIKINFKTFEIQTIGAIFEVRNDGTDSGILLGDDSIKMVYDRNDGKWKGISCGMEYNDYSSEKPKLYFETTQNILDGGIVIVRNAQIIKDTAGNYVGISGSTYAEDFDFYYDSENKYWVVTGNKIGNGYYIYHTPDLKTNYSVALDESSVPDGVADTGNQFVSFDGTRYLTTGGTTNSLGIRDMNGSYLGALDVDVPLSSSTARPWCTLVPFLDGDVLKVFLMSFDRTNLIGDYDHGSLYCWLGYKSNYDANKVVATENDLTGTVGVNFPAGSPLDFKYFRQFSRRDFYNSAASFGEYNLDLNTDLLKTPSSILTVSGNGNFKVSM